MTSRPRFSASKRKAPLPFADDPVHALLSFCARPFVPAELAPELARRVTAVRDWDALLSAAEAHGLSPLLYAHLRAAPVVPPPHAALQLQGLYVRHRRSNRVRLQALSEIVGTLRTRGIDVRVLKGPALMTLVYRDPALRPASDLDLLVARAQAIDAQRALKDLGYATADHLMAGSTHAHHHLPAAIRSIEGVTVEVEVHHDALTADDPASLRLDATRESGVPFDVASLRIDTLGPHEMLWHLCEHLVGPLPRPLRFIWLADVVGWAAAFDGTLDWQRVRERYPVVLNVLALAHHFTPLPVPLVSRVPPATLDAFELDAAYTQEWLWPSDSRRSDVRRWDQLWRSMRPPAWWTLLRYGASGATPSGRLRHVGIVGRALARRSAQRVAFSVSRRR